MLPLRDRSGARRSLVACFWAALIPFLFLVVLSPVAGAQAQEENQPAKEEQKATESAVLPSEEEELISDEQDAEEIPRGEYVAERDPFRGLAQPDLEMQKRPPGIEGMAISELALVGIIRGQLGAHAVFVGTDLKAYTLTVGDAVYDGKVKSIADNMVIFEQQAFDQLGRPKEPKLITVYLYPVK